MVMTIEPGIYVSPASKDVDKRWRGIGIRIEDDVQVDARRPRRADGGRADDRRGDRAAHGRTRVTAKPEAPLDCDVLIVGGGAVGSALACALAELPLDVVLVEAHEIKNLEQPSFDQRTTALANGSQKILAALGVWRELEGHTEAIRSIHISERGRFGAARIAAADEGVTALGYTVENAALGRVLWERLANAPRLRTFAPARVDAAYRRGRCSDRGHRAGRPARARAARRRRGRRAVVGARGARNRRERARLRAARLDLQLRDRGAARGARLRALYAPRADRVPAAHGRPRCRDLDAADGGRRAGAPRCRRTSSARSSSPRSVFDSGASAGSASARCIRSRGSRATSCTASAPC